MRLIDADELKIELTIHYAHLNDKAAHTSIESDKMMYINTATGVIHAINKLNDAPTVIPFSSVQYETFREYERPIGKWLNNRVAFHFTCDYCGCNIRQLKDEVFEGDYDYNFCPNCGAAMRGKDNGKEETT